MKTICLLILALLLVTVSLPLYSQYPAAPVRNVVDEYWGVKVIDPYRYMENLADPAVQKWIKAEADYAQRILSGIPGRKALYDRIKELDKGKPYRISYIQRQKDGSLFYLKMLASENISKLYFRSKSGEERLLVDPEKIGAGQKAHYSIEVYTPTSDGAFLVYGLAKGGSEETVYHILNLKTGAKLKETIDRIETAYNAPAWAADNNGFYYCRRQKLPSNAPATEVYKNTKTFFHKLEDPPGRDREVFSRTAAPNVPMTDTDFPSIYLPPGSAWAVGQIKHGDATEITLVAAPVSSLSEKRIPWKKICTAKHEVVAYAVHGDDIYLLTAKGAPRYKIVRTPLFNPDFEKAETVLPPSAKVIDDLAAAKDGLYVNILDAGVNQTVRIEYGNKSKPKTLRLPGGASGSFYSASQELDGALVRSSSWTRGNVMYAYDPHTKKFTDSGLIPKGKYDDVPGFESREVKVKSHDGVLVPLSVIYKKGIRLDGSHPALIDGYGGYGISQTVYFSPITLAWLEQGGVLATAHVRGGGEYGREWHLAGRKLTKPNTWKDFIACAEYLIQKGYTSKTRLAGQGGSAGGILIGRAITERPDLFAAAIINVGCLDALRFETTTNGVPNIPEFGTVREKDGFKGLYEMSPYHHVKEGVRYPAVLLTTGINDPRVDPWESAKMTARLQAASVGNKPVLLRVDYDAGHGIGSTRDQRLQEIADEWAFLLWQFGMPGYE